MLLNSLLCAFPENGIELYRSIDYWQCRELLDLSSDGRMSSEDRIQAAENHVFNTYLDRTASNKIAWVEIEELLDLRDIYEKSKVSLE
ncbi:hypothetical protein [Chroococcidiopsis sp.]|uniref:hypothetical protein n=1 Tax=Chroococcidiopsis sp. TaxID=3088168 RepID=UPI003F36D390